MSPGREKPVATFPGARVVYTGGDLGAGRIRVGQAGGDVSVTSSLSHPDVGPSVIKCQLGRAAAWMTMSSPCSEIRRPKTSAPPSPTGAGARSLGRQTHGQGPQAWRGGLRCPDRPHRRSALAWAVKAPNPLLTTASRPASVMRYCVAGAGRLRPADRDGGLQQPHGHQSSADDRRNVQGRGRQERGLTVLDRRARRDGQDVQLRLYQ